MLQRFADRMLLFPSTGPGAVHGIHRQVIGGLEYWSGRFGAEDAGHPERFVLCFHGNRSRADREFARMDHLWGNFPIELWAVNYPGFGGSRGRASMTTLAEAALQAFDTLSERAAGHPVYLTGHSMGTVLALVVAARRKVAGLVLHNPPPLRELITKRYGWWNLWLAATATTRGLPRELDSIENARRSIAPALFLIAGKDRLVPPRYQLMIAGAYGGPKRVVHLLKARHKSPVLENDRALVDPAMQWLWNEPSL